jgi:hypothetical protein
MRKQRTYENVSLVPSTRSMYSFSSRVSIDCGTDVSCHVFLQTKREARLLYILDLGVESLRNLGDDLLNEDLVLQGLQEGQLDETVRFDGLSNLSGFHDSEQRS